MRKPIIDPVTYTSLAQSTNMLRDALAMLFFAEADLQPFDKWVILKQIQAEAALLGAKAREMQLEVVRQNQTLEGDVESAIREAFDQKCH